MATAADVAKYLIRLAGADPEQEPITALRLHKLLYYCQGWHLAWHGRPLFADRLEAGKYGPVVPTVYAQPWGHGRDPLRDPGGPAALTDAERAAVEQVWSYYRRFSAYGLRERTHGEAPWRNHYAPDANARCSTEIPVPELAGFFGEEFRRRTGEQPGSAAEWEADAGAGRLVAGDQLRKALGW